MLLASTSVGSGQAGSGGRVGSGKFDHGALKDQANAIGRGDVAIGPDGSFNSFVREMAYFEGTLMSQMRRSTFNAAKAIPALG